jgi:hypothetical protein
VSPLRFEIVYPAGVDAGPLDGRVLLVIAKTDRSEPRFQVGWGLNTQPIFGVDVEGLRPGEPAVIDGSARGYPVESIAQIPPGDYYVQAVLNVYTTFRRADGHTIKAHMDATSSACISIPHPERRCALRCRARSHPSPRPKTPNTSSTSSSAARS